MREFSNLVLIIAGAFLVGACSTSPEVETAESLNQYIADPDHRLHQVGEIDRYYVTVTYRPADLLVYQEIGDQPSEVNTLETLKKKYANYHYFILSLSKRDADGSREEALHQVGDGDMDQYSELVQTLSFRMRDYVTLTTSEHDTIPVADFMLNRTYGLSESTDLLFVFNKEKSLGKDWIQFNLNEFGLGTGNQRFRFMTKDIDQVPRLQFNVISGT
ncbi:MAG: hypothetical protein ACOYXT_04045 [Bacteroidota bacterium]